MSWRTFNLDEGAVRVARALQTRNPPDTVVWLNAGMPATDSTIPTLSRETREIVAATTPVLEANGLAIATRLYKRLFDEHPEMEGLFSGAAPGQANRLAGAIVAYAQNIDEVETLVPVVRSIAAKHVTAGVVPDHYEIVGNTLLASMVDVLGELEPDVIDGWADAYTYLAELFISIESDLAPAQ